MNRKLLLAASVLVAVAAVLFAISKKRDSAWRAPAGIVSARGIRFLLDGRPYRFVGANVAVMYRGQVVEAGPVDQVFHGATHPYTRRLLAATLNDAVNVTGDHPQAITAVPVANDS